MAALLPNAKQSFTTSTGTPLSGGRLYTYDAGTNNPRPTYQDAAGTVPNTNPVVLDARGEATIFWDGNYKVVLKDASDNLIWSVDNVQDASSDASLDVTQLRADLADASTAGKGTSLLGWVRAAASAVATTVKSWLSWQSVNVFEFMTVAQIADVQARSLTLDTTAAWTAAMNAAVSQGRKKIIAPAGAYLLNGGAVSPDGFKNGVLVPFATVNFDPELGITIEGEGGSTALYAGSDNMILARVSRNNVTMRNITFNANGKVNVWGLGIVPEDMTQTTTLVSQSFFVGENLSRIGAFTEGIVLMPGPNVGGADSGCFYHTFYNGIGNLIGGKRHVWLKKNVDWATAPNRPTRTSFFGEKLIRGNTGYHFDVGSEIELHGCCEEMINSGAVPNATPTARYVGTDVSTAILFFGGYAEACTQGVDIQKKGVVKSYSYSFNSGLNNWLLNASSFDDYLNDRPFTPVVNSSGGGVQGASTSTGYAVRNGRMVSIIMNISAAKGTLAAGSLVISGLPFIAKSGYTHGLSLAQFSGITLGAGYTGIGTFLNGASLGLRKLSNTGLAPVQLTIAECADPIEMTIVGTYIADN